MTSHLIQAQSAELDALCSILLQHAKSNVSILDIGVGDARVPSLLRAVNPLWDRIARYDGVEHSASLVQKAQQHVREQGLEGKVSIISLDANDLQTIKDRYDFVICTYFTAGNFVPESFSFATDQHGKLSDVSDVKTNPSFSRVFRSAYDLLLPGGELVLGSVYVDSPETRRRQEEFYEKCGMTVITDESHSFTATKEGFWSERFTPEKIKRYVDWISHDNTQFIPLDLDGFAMLVRIKKQ